MSREGLTAYLIAEALLLYLIEIGEYVCWNDIAEQVIIYSAHST